MKMMLNSTSLSIQAVILMAKMIIYIYIYMLPSSSSPSRTRTHDRKHQKKKLGQHFCQTKPNKLYLISPLPDCRLNSILHSSKYDRKQSSANKSSAPCSSILLSLNKDVVVNQRTLINLPRKSVPRIQDNH